MVTEEQLREALKEVIDPELGVSLVEMGLIKDVKIEGNVAQIKMTLTSPSCPLTKYIVEQVKQKAESIEGIKSANVELIF